MSERMVVAGRPCAYHRSMASLCEQLAALVRAAPMPAVAVGVFTRTDVIAELVHGVADLDTGRLVEPADWWDLASLTKTVVTVPEVLDLVARGRIGLDQPLRSAWEDAQRSSVADASIAQLLSYNAGLPSSVPFFRTLRGRDAIIDAALATPPERPIGSEAAYSDVNFILLGAMVEALTGRSLAVLAPHRSGLRYPPVPGDAVATERCPWRRRLIVGEAHDENTAAMGGISGHAGAFATIELLVQVAQGWLAERVVDERLHRQARRPWSTNGEGERFGLGWWLAPTRGIGGTLAGMAGYGMSGFVGNRIWIEPEHDYGVVVLSNRVHPTRPSREPFNAWCGQLLDTVARSRAGGRRFPRRMT
jgi:CubicO group peptidase (beta-lactamase class C family)